MEKKDKNGFEEMVAIQVAIKGWPGRISLKPEDLGLEEKEIPEIFHLGNKKLYSQDWRSRFNTIHSRARNFLNDNSFPFVLEWVRAVPKRNLAKLMAGLDEIKAEYMALAQEFIGCYEEIKEEWAQKYPDLWPRLEPHYPTKQWLEHRFRFTVNIFDIKGAEVKPGSAPEIIAAYEQARQDLKERYDEMVEEAVVYLRKKVLEVVTNLGSRLKEGRIVRTDTLDSVRRVEGWFKDLNIFGDHQVEETLTKLRTAINGTDYEALKDNEPLKEELAKLADQVADAASKITDVTKVAGRYKRHIDLK